MKKANKQSKKSAKVLKIEDLKKILGGGGGNAVGSCASKLKFNAGVMVPEGS